MWEILKENAGWLVALIATIFAVRGTVRFDINTWLQQRQENRKLKVRRLCTHTRFVETPGGITVRATCESPRGTHDWVCGTCGQWMQESKMEEMINYWAQNPELWIKQDKEFDRYVKSL